MPTEPLLPEAPLCWPARWGAVLAQGLESSAQARLLFSFQPHPGKAEVLETPTPRLPALQAHRRSQIPAAAHQPPASTCHAPGGAVAHGSGARPTSVPRPSPTGKPLRVCLDCFAKPHLTTATFYFLRNMCLTFVCSISTPSPTPTRFPVLVPGAVSSLGEQGEVFQGDTRLPPCCLALGQQA